MYYFCMYPAWVHCTRLPIFNLCIKRSVCLVNSIAVLIWQLWGGHLGLFTSETNEQKNQLTESVLIDTYLQYRLLYTPNTRKSVCLHWCKYTCVSDVHLMLILINQKRNRIKRSNHFLCNALERNKLVIGNFSWFSVCLSNR